jgi:hypothetical protein
VAAFQGKPGGFRTSRNLNSLFEKVAVWESGFGKVALGKWVTPFIGCFFLVGYSNRHEGEFFGGCGCFFAVTSLDPIVEPVESNAVVFGERVHRLTACFPSLNHYLGLIASPSRLP